MGNRLLPVFSHASVGRYPRETVSRRRPRGEDDDVEQIARDLVEEAIRLEKDRRREAVRESASEAAMERLLAMTTSGVPTNTTGMMMEKAMIAGPSVPLGVARGASVRAWART